MRLWHLFIWACAALLSIPIAQAASPPDTAATAPAPTVLNTESFLRQAASVLKFEVASSQLALRKTKSEPVQNFARQLGLDYAAAGMKFRQIVNDAKFKVPREALDARHKSLSDELAHTPPGKSFTKAYPEVQLRALRDDLDAFQAYAKDGDDDRLKYFAQEMVTLLRSHLEQAEKLRR